MAIVVLNVKTKMNSEERQKIIENIKEKFTDINNELKKLQDLKYDVYYEYDETFKATSLKISEYHLLE